MPKNPAESPFEQTSSRKHPGVATVKCKQTRKKNSAKPRKLKAYLIVHDEGHVLVGTGGQSGWNERRGYHLPGGTIDPGENAQEAALRELKEETGIDRAQLLPGIESCITPAVVPNVTFVVVRAANVDALVANFERPVVDDQADEPFSELVSLRSENSWNDRNFAAEFWTDWFKHGLYAARELINPQVNTPS